MSAFKVKIKGKQQDRDRLMVNLFFLSSPTDAKIMKGVRRLAEQAKITPTEVIRQMIAHCLAEEEE